MAPYLLKNKFIAPTFENGVNGWTVSGTGASGVVLSTSTNHSVNGTQCLKVSVPAGSGTVRLVPPSFPMILDPYRLFALTFSAASSINRTISYGYERFKATTLAYHNENLMTSGLTPTFGKVSGLTERIEAYNAHLIGGLLPKIIVTKTTVAVDYYFDGFTFLDSGDTPYGVLYGFSSAQSPYDVTKIPQIGGSWPANDSYSYSWTGAVEASTSVATHRAELTVPADFRRGDTIAVTGTGFPASSTVDIIMAENWASPPVVTGVPTDASGNLSISMTAPYATEPGPAYIIGKPANGSAGSMSKQDVWSNPSDLSGTVTNYFPNPNGQTLSGDGVTPKHFSANYEEDVVTRVSVDGAYRARIAPAYNDVYLELGESGNAIGLVDGKQYIIRARVQSDAVSNDPWAYTQTSSGNSDNTLTGTSPWEVIGIGTGVFDGPCQFNSYSWPDGATVDLDHISIVEGATYLLSWARAMQPGDTLDGYMIGLRPGREYQLAGFTYGTFKVRTGTSAESLTDALVWNNVNPDEWAGGAVTRTFAIPAGHNVIQLEASGADVSEISIHDYIPYFDGDTPDDGTYAYSWAGTPGDSASLRTAAAPSSGLTAQVFTGGTAKTVSEMRVSAGGILINITEAGG